MLNLANAKTVRIQYKNAFYHVINRGSGYQRIFHNEGYYQPFMKTLEEPVRFDAAIHAYCPMANHYHLLIETLRANLGRIMRRVSGADAQRYNRLKKPMSILVAETLRDRRAQLENI